MSDKLLTTLANFEQWRLTKTARGIATPLNLRLEAIELLSQYSISTIVTTLRLSYEQLNSWRQVDNSGDNNAHFITLPQEPISSAAISIELKFVNGNQLALSGELNEHVILQLIEAVKL